MRNLTILALLAFSLAGCKSAPTKPTDYTYSSDSKLTVIAQRTKDPVKIDGSLLDDVWNKAQKYNLSLSHDKNAQPTRRGNVKLAWDKNYLYIAVEYEDRDIVAKGTKDNEPHFKLGDLAEVFLKPEKSEHYWEFYVTPHAKKTTYWFSDSTAFKRPNPPKIVPDLTVGATIAGTFNSEKDWDRYWSGEMAIPIKELEKHGDKFIGGNWTILVSRYNYSRSLKEKSPELTMVPQLPKSAFHDTSNYAKLKLAK